MGVCGAGRCAGYVWIKRGERHWHVGLSGRAEPERAGDESVLVWYASDVAVQECLCCGFGFAPAWWGLANFRTLPTPHTTRLEEQYMRTRYNTERGKQKLYVS